MVILFDQPNLLSAMTLKNTAILCHFFNPSSPTKEIVKSDFVDFKRSPPYDIIF